MSVRPKKGLGQHFLADPGVVHRIVDAVEAPPEARVVEIGPGEGAMTGALLARYPSLVALEIDGEAVAHLRQRYPALDLREGDVLEADWSALARDLPPAASTATPEASGAGSAPSLFVAGNLPYYITSPILLGLLDARAHVARAVVMVQKEVAERVASPHGSKTYGTLSVYFALYARTEPLFTVPPEAFRPPPKVDSAVLAIDFRRPAPEAGGVAFGALQRVVRAAFGQRRKMLRNSLGPLAASAGRGVPGWAATLRPEQVSPADFVRLTHALL